MARLTTFARSRTKAVPADPWQLLAGHYDRQAWLERSAVRAALNMADPRPLDRLLDLGTGTGMVLRELAKRPGRPDVVVGIDASTAMLARVPALPSGWTVHHGDALDLPFPASDFDIVVASYVLHVLPDAVLAAALSQLTRVLRPSGRLVTVTPIVPPRGLMRPVATACNAAARSAPSRLGGLRAFDPRPALEHAGFTPISSRVILRGYPSLCVLAHGPALTPARAAGAVSPAAP